jgi:hypothetical protein
LSHLKVLFGLLSKPKTFMVKYIKLFNKNPSHVL